jgi:hypothetical protein
MSGRKARRVGQTAHPHGVHHVPKGARHPDREQLLRIADSMRRMHTSPNTQHGPLTVGEKATMVAHAEQIKSIAEKPEAA